MHKGMKLALAASWLLLCATPLSAQIYKVVDESGNITYTDQAPSDGSGPMDLPELSVVQTDPVPPPRSDDASPARADENTSSELTPRQLRRMYRDFRITRPQAEETFWGTGQQVVVSWGASAPLQAGMSVRLLVDGQPQADTQQSMLALTLERGEHRVQAELRDNRGRRVVISEPVTFFVKQNSVNFNRPATNPNGNT